MSSKIRILTFHHITNHGAFLFAHSILNFLQNEFKGSDVKIIDYKAPRLALYEALKYFKIFQNIPLFYANRSTMWRRIVSRDLDLDTDIPHFIGQKQLQQYFSQHYDGLIVGMDVWSIIGGTERPRFPNIYWLPEKMSIPKIAYGVSGYRSDELLIHKHSHEITRYLNDFEVIGSRDRFTHELVLKYRTRSDGLVERVPDPAFLYRIQKTNVAEKLSSIGVDLNRPILGILLYGEDKLAQEIRNFYREKGYQIVALSMYNRYADFNTGHFLAPREWAEVFRLLTFCITDRFHGAVFCLKNQTPFISLDKEKLPRTQSKIFDLLAIFELTECYENIDDHEFDFKKFLDHAEEIEAAWGKYMMPQIMPKIREINVSHREFIRKMKKLLDW